jgi:hypothetical protein
MERAPHQLHRVPLQEQRKMDGRLADSPIRAQADLRRTILVRVYARGAGLGSDDVKVASPSGKK